MLTQKIQMLVDHPVGGRNRQAGDTLYLDRKTAEFLIKTGLGVEVAATAPPPMIATPAPLPTRPILTLKKRGRPKKVTTA